jgi:hypothetical protein
LLDLGGIAEIDAVGEADIVCTGRIEAVIDPVGAEVTLLSGSVNCVEDDGSVRACLKAGLAPRAAFPVEDDDSVLPLGDSLFRAGLHARGSVTVFADAQAVNEIELPTNPFRIIFRDVNIIDPIRLMMLLLAGDFTGFTSPASILIDTEHNLAHDWSPDC